MTDINCACRFVRREEFSEVEQTEWCGLHAIQRDMISAVRVARDALREARTMRCACSSFVIQYEGRCACSKGEQIKAAEARLKGAVDEL